MGKGDRKASSARAAESLGGSAKVGGTFAFGGYSGAQKVEDAPLVSSPASSGDSPDAAPFTADLDSELVQHLRRLSKRDPTTRLKALQAMRRLIQERSPEELTPVLPVWVYTFKKLVMDNDRAVRQEAMRAQGELACRLGKQLAPFLKPLMPSWWMGQHDNYREVQGAGTSGFQEAFPGPKASEALLFCRSQILEFLTEKLEATPQSLAESASKESKEEMQDRWERVVYSCLHSLGDLLAAVVAEGAAAGGQGSSRAKAVEEVLSGAAEVLSRKGFYKAHLGSKCPAVRRAAFSMVKTVCQSSASVLEPSLPDLAPALLGSVAERDRMAASLMWDAALSCVKAFPGMWEHVSMRKAFLPKLYTVLRNDGYETGSIAYQALLPLVANLPPPTLGPQAAVPIEVLRCAWEGLQQPSLPDAGKREASTAVADVLTFALAGAEKHSPGEADAYAEEVMQAVVRSLLVPAALSGAGGGSSCCSFASSALVQVTGSFASRAGGNAGAERRLMQLLSSVGGSVASEVAATKGAEELRPQQQQPAEVLGRAGDLVRALNSCCQAAGVAVAAARDAVGAEVAAAVLPLVHSGDPGAASLMAELVEAFGAEVAASAAPMLQAPEDGAPPLPGQLTVPSLLCSCLGTMATASASGGSGRAPEVGSNADLLLSLLRQQPSPAEALAALVSSLSAAPAATLRDPAAAKLLAQLQEELQRLPEAARANAGELAVIVVERAASAAPSAGNGASDELTAPVSCLEAAAMWHSEPLDAVAVSLARQGCSAAEEPGDETSERLLAGLMASGRCGSATQAVCLVSEEALAEILGVLAAPVQQLSDLLLTSCGSSSGTQTGTREEEEQGASSSLSLLERPALFAMRVLDGSTFKAPPGKAAVSASTEESLSQIVSAVFSLSWHGGPGNVGRAERVQEGDEAETMLSEAMERSLDLGTATGAGPGAAALACALWARGSRAAGVISVLSESVRRQVLGATVERLRAGMAAELRRGNGGAEAEHEEAAWGRLWSLRLQEVLEATGASSSSAQEELQGALDAVLAPLEGWPHWAPGHHQGGAEQQDHQAGSRMSAFCTALCRALGTETVLLGSPGTGTGAAAGQGRSWLAGELLCQWAVSGEASEDAAAAELVIPCLAMAAHEDPQSPFVASVLEQCLSGAMAGPEVAAAWRGLLLMPPGMEGDDHSEHHAVEEDVYLHALYAALAGLVGSMESSATVHLAIERFFESRVAPLDPLSSCSVAEMFSDLSELREADEEPRLAMMPPVILTRILEIVASPLRTTPRSANNLLGNLATRWLSATAALPAPALTAQLRAEGSERPAAAARAARDLRRWCAVASTALAAVPVPAKEGLPCVTVTGGSTAEEQKALLGLVRALASGRHRAATAKATAERYGSSSSSAEDHEELAEAMRKAQAESEELSAKLGLATMAYCWDAAEAQDWDLLLEALGNGLSAAAVEAEEMVEGIAEAVRSAASELAHTDLTPSQSVVVLQQLSNLGRLPQEVSEASAPLLPAAAHHHEEPHLRPGSSSYDTATPMAQQLVVVLRLWGDFGKSLPAPRGWPGCAEDGISNALRLVFCWGAAETLAATASPRGGMSSGSSSNLPSISAAAPVELVWEARETCSDLLTAAGSVAHACVSGTDKFLAEAINAADAWEDDSGVNATDSLLALALSPRPSPALRHAALQILRTTKLSRSLTTAADADEDDEVEDGDGEEGAAGDGPTGRALAALIRAGIRPALARGLCSPPTEEVRLLSWLLLLHHTSQLPPTCYGRRMLAQALRDVPFLVPQLLDLLLPLLDLPPPPAKGKPEPPAPSDRSPDWLQLTLESSEVPETYLSSHLASAAFALALRTLPASVRLWFSDLRDNVEAAAIERYTIRHESPWMLEAEMSVVQESAASSDLENFSVKVNSGVREVVATMELDDDAKLEMAVRLPMSFPLRAGDAEIRRKVGVTEGRLRKWLMSISVFLRNYNGTVVDAIELWRKNVEKEFEGLDDCLICYSVIHPTNRSLPRLGCRTCAKKFHAACLYKWFKSSGKSNCPHCQSPW